jgi:hypothetical protein
VFEQVFGSINPLKVNSLTIFFFFPTPPTNMSSTNMSSQPVKRQRVHQKEKGTERCGHQCEGRDCVNASTKSLDWKKEGSAAARHEKSMVKHPQCTQTCPSFKNLRPSTRPVTASQPRASGSSSQTLSIPAGTSERSSSLNEFDMDVDQAESPVTEGITGWYLLINDFLLAFLTFSTDRQTTFHSGI